MNQKVRKLLKAAKNDKNFQDELKIYEPKDYKVDISWTNNEQILYASVYMGWLIGKGIYNEKNYE